MRVAAVTYRLSVEGIATCRASATPQSGVVLHSAAQYAQDDAAATVRGVGDRAIVLGVVAGSPAEEAGLSAEDEILTINGEDLDVVPAGKRMERATTMLAEALDRGGVTLAVSSQRGRREVRFHGALGCPARIEVLTDAGINAWADGERVMITTGIVVATRSDDELAIVIAHEMAHNILRHRARLGASELQSALLPTARPGSAALTMRATEEEADRFAVGLAGAAGYDLTQAAPFLQRVMISGGIAKHAADTHPAGDRRIALLTAAIAQSRQRSDQR